MKMLRRVTAVLLFLVLAAVQWAGIAQAQYGSPGGGSGDQNQAAVEEGEYDYVADAENEWTAEYGEDGSGDWRYYRNPLYDSDYEEEIGWADGRCVQTAPGEWAYCDWSLYANTWTLNAHGVVDETNGDNWFAVTGGTGAYADVSGYVTIAPNEDYSWYDISFEIYVAPYTYWQSVSWGQVTEEEASYWYTLGWDEYNWDGSHPSAVPDSESRTWEELTEYEQEAATAVGYDETTWNPSSVRTPDGDPYTYWAGYSWDELYLSEKRLWGILGWNEGNWPGIPEAGMPASNWRTWEELTPVEQGAARYLGYDEESWNVTVVRTPEGEVEEYWSQYGWADLYYGEKQLFGYLGWNANSWAGDAVAPETRYRTWEQLSPVQKGAATQLGYNAENWDAGVLEH